MQLEMLLDQVSHNGRDGAADKAKMAFWREEAVMPPKVWLCLRILWGAAFFLPSAVHAEPAAAPGAQLHPEAAHNLPSFIAAPGDTDVLMVVTGLFLVFAVLMFGVVFFRLHSLPERIAHKSHKLQFELVAVLALISLFTHMHIFWVAGLLLALVDLPDFGTPLNRIAGSAEKLAGIKADEGTTDAPDLIEEKVDAAVQPAPKPTRESGQADDIALARAKPKSAVVAQKEANHA
jgi:hypothetical protein